MREGKSQHAEKERVQPVGAGIQGAVIFQCRLKTDDIVAKHTRDLAIGANVKEL